MSFFRFTALGVALVSLLLMPDMVVACPNCKAAVAESHPPAAIAFAWSIGLMILAPAAILGGWIVMFRAMQRGERTVAQACHANSETA